MLRVGMVAGLATAFLAAAPAEARVPACFAASGQAAQADGVTVRDVAEREGDYRILRVEAPRAAHMLIYYDAASEGIARSRAACLGAQLSLLQVDLLDTREGAEWHSVVFTANPDYAPPSGPDRKVRWVVRTSAAGTEAANIDQMVLIVLPHEQVHDFQYRARARLPRWFAEGHATWTGLRITALLDPGRGAQERADRLRDRTRATGPLALASWGSVRPRREAILRQVSAEDRARMEADPTYLPNRAFRFTTADLEGDESNMPARYAGALMVFDDLEARHGVGKVRAWAREVTLMTGSVTHTQLAESVRRHFDEDLDALLTAHG